jgi:hypothetical protein
MDSDIVMISPFSPPSLFSSPLLLLRLPPPLSPFLLFSFSPFLLFSFSPFLLYPVILLSFYPFILLSFYPFLLFSRYLEAKHYSWAGIADIPGLKGKARRALLQFTPESWTVVDWEPTRR